MSAPPSAAPNGARPGAPANGAPPVRKQPPKTNIFNTKKPRRVLPSTAQRPGAPPTANPQARPPPPAVQQPAIPQNTNAEEGAFTDYPIIIKKQVGDEGKRFHAFKLQTRTGPDGQPVLVNPYDPQQFERPLRLFRRYGTDKMETADSEGTPGVDDKEKEMMLARQAEKQAEKEENKKLIAPTGGESSKPGKKKPSKKVEEGRDDSDPIRQKRRQLRYEEAKRWHLEDKQGKNIWVGNYEEALSENSVLLNISEGEFRVVPVERWYKFIQTNKFDTMTSDEIEKFLQKKAQPSRWALKTQTQQLNSIMSGYDSDTQRELKKELKRRAEARAFESTQRVKHERQAEYQGDRDLLDLEVNDEFQDDDEGALFQGDEGEDAKDIEKKLWEEMRNAGLGGTGVKNEELDPEEEERKRLLEEAEEKKKSKRLRRQLQRREHKGEYESDSDGGNRYESSSDSDEDDDLFKDKDEEAKKEEAKKLANGDKSGASSRGNNTPSGRPEKRPNPDASDASGNESSRKRAKGMNGSAISNGQGGARSLSPDAAKPKKIKAPRSTAGSGSGSDTDTSRVGRPKKLKKEGAGSPNGSRAGSPSASGSRAQSPTVPADNFPTLAEISAAIPPEGIKIPMLVQLFKSRVAKRGAEFIALVKSAGVQDKSQQGVIRPKSSA